MLKKCLVLIIFLIIFPIFTIYAQEETLVEDVAETEEADANPISDRPDFWIGLGLDTAFYGTKGLSYGGGLTLGHGSGSSIGIKVSMFYSEEYVSLLEFDLLLRFYLFGRTAYWGPFIQIIGGAALVNYRETFVIPSSTGIFNAGLSFGWRFLISKNFFVEPAIRGGYPYFYGLGTSIGVRF